MNSCRVFIQELVWEQDPVGWKDRFDGFLALAAGCGLSVMPVLFDDCAFARSAPFLGKQAEPIPGRMMTSWTASPGHARVADRASWPALERYVADLLSTFGRDRRIVAWDLYNEPGNEGMGEQSRPLLEATFDWAEAARPDQPLTAGLWNLSDAFARLNRVHLDRSDVISFHTYSDLPATLAIMARLKAQGRPALCTEWMARPLQSRIQTHLPMFHGHGVGCYLWGLVNGRTQTHIPWETIRQRVSADDWFHDLFRPDGTPYCPEELEVIRRETMR